MGEERRTAYPPNAIHVCIDWYNGDFAGRIYNKMRAAPLMFHNCVEMLLRVDTFLDACGYPQTFQEKRSFRKSSVHQGVYKLPRLLLNDDEVWKQRGERYTLDVIIRSRRRAGWQGYVRLLDGTIGEYRSEIELLNYIVQLLQLNSCKQTAKTKLQEIC